MKFNSTYNYILMSLMAAIICILAPIALPLPFTPVPISLGILAIYLAAYVLKPQFALASVAIYILLGIVGLPVFSGFSGGIGKIAGPTGGYIVGYLALAPICSVFFHRFKEKRIMHIIGMILSLIVCYGFGTIWFCEQQKMNFIAALNLCVIPFILGDVLKIIVAVIAGPEIVKRISKINLN